MPQCLHCQQAVDAGAQRCPQCGAWLADAPKINTESLESSVRALLDQDRKIQAIKFYREQTGAGLADAKNAVERFECGETAPVGRSAANDLEKQILELMAAGQKIAAIKLHREQTNSGLKEAKDAVELLAARHGISTNRGCLGVLVLLLCGVYALLAG